MYILCVIRPIRVSPIRVPPIRVSSIKVRPIRITPITVSPSIDPDDGDADGDNDYGGSYFCCVFQYSKFYASRSLRRFWTACCFKITLSARLDTTTCSQSYHLIFSCYGNSADTFLTWLHKQLELPPGNCPTLLLTLPSALLLASLFA